MYVVELFEADNIDGATNPTMAVDFMIHHVDTVQPVCGNGELEDGEGCDDGNFEVGDGCDEACLVEPEPPLPPQRRLRPMVRSAVTASSTPTRAAARPATTATRSTAMAARPRAPSSDQRAIVNCSG